jgi:adenylate cyclase
MGFFGFLFARKTMLNEWKEASILKLERAAHFIDMRLDISMKWIEMFNKTGGMRDGYAVQEWIVQQLKDLKGVAKVNLNWTNTSPEPMVHRGTQMGRSGTGFGMGRKSMMHFHRARISEVTPPQHDAQIGQETVSLISNFKDESGTLIGTLEVAIRFDYLLQDIQSLGWWQSDFAGLVDDTGRYLAHTEALLRTHNRLGETEDPLELALLAAIKKERFGTLMGPGHPPNWVSGFYRLKNASWTIVLFAPGKKILASIVRFRFYYFAAGSLCIILIILLIRFVVGRSAHNITGISAAAEKVERGVYGEPLPIPSGDEIGQLTQSFNKMVQGLKERDFIRNTFGRYVDEEIAKELMKQPERVRLGGERRDVAILMSDLRNFTPLSESLTPEETIRVLNNYFSHMIEIIQKNHGIIVDFFGDALLVFFDPLDGPIIPSVRQAIRCALDMQKDIGNYNIESGAAGLPELEMGIGVNAGEVVVGNIGSAARAKYGIVGAPVNMTNRIQAVAAAGEVVVSESVYRFAKDELVVKRSTTVQLKGIREPVKLYAIESFQNEFNRVR